MRPALVALSAVAGLGAATPNVTLFKRTHASCAASRDGTFVRDRLGMTVTSNSSYSCAGDECADRVVATTLGNFEMHYFTSYVTPEKGVTTCDFASSFAAANAWGDADWSYSEWAAQGVSFYVPTLHPHLKAWRKHDVAYLGRSSNDPSSGRTVFSARVVVPHCGHVVEVVSGVVGAEYVANFSEYGAGECGAGTAMVYDLATMDAAWTAQGGLESNSMGFPDLLPVLVSQPVTDVAALPKFLFDYSGAVLNTTIDAVEGDDDGDDDAYAAGGVDDDCTYSTTTLDLSTLVNAWAVGLRLVRNDRATASANYSAAFFANYVSDAADAEMGCDAGYSRYVDSHVGVTVEGASLDFNARGLCADGVGVHTGDTGDGTGSNWARGASGVGVEFHGDYDYSFFSEFDLFVLDYCAASGFGVSADACESTSNGRNSPRTPVSASRSILTNRWFWLGLFFIGGLLVTCYIAAVEEHETATTAGAARGSYSRFRSTVRGAFARATARRADEATYVIVKDEDQPEMAEVVSAELYQADAS